MRPVLPLLSDEFVADVAEELLQAPAVHEAFAAYRAAPPSEAAFAELHAALWGIRHEGTLTPTRVKPPLASLSPRLDRPRPRPTARVLARRIELPSLVDERRRVGDGGYVGRAVLVRPLSDPNVRGDDRLELPAACGSFAAVDAAARVELERRASHGLPAITRSDALLLVEDRALPRGWDLGCVEVCPAAWGCDAAVDEAARAEEQRRARQLVPVRWHARQALRWHDRTPPHFVVQDRARRSVLGEPHLER